MRALMAALAAGLALTAWLPLTAAPWMRHLLPGALISLLAALCLLGLWQQRGASWPRWLLVLFLALLAGMLWSLTRAGLHHQRLLPPALAGTELWLSGEVISLPRDFAASQQFELRVHAVCFQLNPKDCVVEAGDPLWQPYHALLMGRRLVLTHYDSSLLLRAGEHWQLRVRLQMPRGLVNPAGQDREAINFQRGISARGHVRETAWNQRLGHTRLSHQRWRQQLHQRLQQLPVAEAQRALLLALIVGDRSLLSDEQWQLFSATGTNHLVVISGLHIGFVTALAYALASWLARLSPALLLRMPAQRLAVPAAMMAAAAYAMLAGFSLPTQRALIMVLVAMIARWRAQRHAFSLGFLLALVAVLLHDPLSVLGAGFWLSFGAVAALIWVFGNDWRPRPLPRPRQRGWRWRQWLRGFWQHWLRPQWVVFVALFVPLTMFIGSVSLLAPLANVLAIPLISLWVVPASLLAALLLPLSEPLALLLFTLADYGLQLLQFLLKGLLALAPDTALLDLPGLSPLVLVATLLAAGLLLLPRGWPARYLVLPLLLPLLLGSSNERPGRGQGLLPGQVQLTVLDAGQGLAVVLRTRAHTLVYDTGPGANIIAPYLRRHGRRHIDALIISHWHQDHSGGLAVLQRDFAVTHTLAGTARQRGMDLVDCEAGMSWHFDQVLFEVLHPGGRHYRGENDNSCVLRVTAGQHRLLLTGDIESAAEHDLLRHGEAALAAQFMLAPHHGSASSSSAALLNAVAPELVIYSAGYNNRFGHPDPSVLQRYTLVGARVIGTPQAGAISLRLGGAEAQPTVLRQRVDRPRYWRLPPSA